MDVEGQLRHLAKDQLYNQKFKKFLYYHWVLSFIICRYNLNSHKKGKFYSTPRNRSLLYTLIAYTKTTNQNLVWDDFEEFYALITYSQLNLACHTSLRVGQNTKKSSLYLLYGQITHPQHGGDWNQGDLDHDDQCLS
jgi:hypothetical protein